MLKVDRIAELTPTFATTTSDAALQILAVLCIILELCLQMLGEIGTIYTGLSSIEDGNI